MPLEVKVTLTKEQREDLIKAINDWYRGSHPLPIVFEPGEFSERVVSLKVHEMDFIDDVKPDFTV